MICSSITDNSPEDTLQCELCGKATKNKGISYTQTSVSENFPSRLRNKMKSHTQEVTPGGGGGGGGGSGGAAGPQIEIDCPKCPSKEASYAQVQLRSADEGSTIFYTCLRCKHRWADDN